MESLLGAVASLAPFFLGLFQQEAGVAFTSRPYKSEVNVTNGERFGNWTWPEMCPDQFFAVGFSTRVQAYLYPGDNTAMNGIRLICSKDGNRSLTYSVESHTGYWGNWSLPQFCPSGVLSSFQLRVEGHRGRMGDDSTAVNNIKFRCSSGRLLKGTGTKWGLYGEWSQNCDDGGICGIETKMEEELSGGDNTALNDVRFRCCAREPSSD
ncbi:vitelline membrane outer layer protein 1 homolog [Limanda limanda]|uniref:vitelline membrane outer layer protein 1 homolog n=1 Tax=Limanda limanda TaxID=27771 RepID=UPI0029C6F484|nr:vitelline membrane outer layer protein 1 homolog [Limanda limanda]